ncbi:MAG: DUF3800 domain-containing protein [Varibaculum sp.]|nr:DUF3800 domain-containing protein [Varibaculum sp.]
MTAMNPNLLTTWSKDFRAPLDTQVAEMFIDESGSKSSRNRFFVLGMVKSRNSAHLAREIRAIRERHNFWKELHFSEVTIGTQQIYMELCELLAGSDTRIGAYVFDKEHADPFKHREVWRTAADCATQLVRGNINKGELVTVYLDLITTPKQFSVAENVKQQVNLKFGSLSVVSALDLDSKSSDLIQMADLVASAIAHYRRAQLSKTGTSEASTIKGKISRRLMRCFDLDDFEDVRHESGKVNIQTAGKPIYRQMELLTGVS